MTSAGLRGATLLAGPDGLRLTAGKDITLRSGKLRTTGEVNISAGGRFLSEPIYIESNEKNRPVYVGWNFPDRYGNPESGHQLSSVSIKEMRAYENHINADLKVNITANENLDLVGSRINSINKGIFLKSATGGINMIAAPGYWTYEYSKTTTKKRLFGVYKTRKTIEVDRYRDIYKPTMLNAEKGVVDIAATGKIIRNKQEVLVEGVSAHNAIMSAGTHISANKVSVHTERPYQSILLGTYTEETLDNVSTSSKRTLFWVVPAGSESTIRERRISVEIGNEMLADEILTLSSAANMTIVGGRFEGRKIDVIAAGNLNILAAIKSTYEKYYSEKDNMVTITTINSGKIVETASLPQILAAKPKPFNVGGSTTIAGYTGPSLNDLLVNSISSRKFDDRIRVLYTPKDKAGADNLADNVSSDRYEFKLPTTGSYSYIDTLLKDGGTTYDPIMLRNKLWYDKQVRLKSSLPGAGVDCDQFVHRWDRWPGCRAKGGTKQRTQQRRQRCDHRKL